ADPAAAAAAARRDALMRRRWISGLRLAAGLCLAVAVAASATATAAWGQYGAAPAGPQRAGAWQPGGMPSPFQRLGFDQRVGQQVPPDLVFRDETGRTVRIGDYFGQRPVVLSLVYFRCPMLCPLTLNGLTRSLKGMSFDAGREFEVVVVSFDPRET